MKRKTAADPYKMITVYFWKPKMKKMDGWMSDKTIGRMVIVKRYKIKMMTDTQTILVLMKTKIKYFKQISLEILRFFNFLRSQENDTRFSK